MDNEMYFSHEDHEDMPKAVRHRKKKLYSAIRERMEFYFSDANLQKDRFLSKIIQDNPEVELVIFLRFNRIQQLTTSLTDLAKALKKSEILQLTEDKSKVFRTTPMKEKDNVDNCTIYVEQLPPDADHDWLTEIFAKYGKVDYVSIPKYKNSGKIKGFAFVEFEKPEFAKNALEEFEREGCCLTSHMNPDQLCSIVTFEEDKCDAKDHAVEQAEAENIKPLDQNDSEENADKEKKGKKRKNTVTEEASEDVVKEKKRKKSQSGEGETENNERENNESENTSMDEAKVANNNEDECLEEEKALPTKKKKNRKKKKSHKTKYVNDIKIYGLQILSKTDWKRLRNKYLNVQKEKMKRLKQHLYKSQLNHSQRQPIVAEPPSKPRFQFTPGLVLKVVFDATDSSQAAQFKNDAKSLDNVEYVDVKQGSREGFIRFREVSTVEELMQSNPQPWENMYVLEGAEEADYWEKMKKDRQEKFENKKKFNKKRGRNKLVNKAEKLISKRIRLSVDE